MKFEGAYIMSVVDGSPAGKAGVRSEDIITKINGDKLTSSNDLAGCGKKKAGDVVTLTIWRDDKDTTLTVTLAHRNNYSHMSKKEPSHQCLAGRIVKKQGGERDIYSTFVIIASVIFAFFPQ